MNTDNIGAALKRKLGPLPVWAWAVISGVALYVLRARGYFQGLGGAQTGTALQPSQSDANVPQSQVQLQPGESVYDPNTGALSTAPGGDTGNGTGTDPSDAINALASAIAAGFTTRVQVAPTTPAKSTQTPGHHHKPQSGKTKRTQKGKRGHGTNHTKTTKHPKAAKRTRSSAKLRNALGGRTRAKNTSGARHHTTPRRPTAPTNPGTRQRDTTPTVTRRTPVQHPVSAHTKSTRPTHPVQPGGPRASAPPPRHQRAPAKPPVQHRSRKK